MSMFKNIEKSNKGPLASVKQWEFIRQLCDETGNDEPEEPLTSGEAGELIEELLDQRNAEFPMAW